SVERPSKDATDRYFDAALEAHPAGGVVDAIEVAAPTIDPLRGPGATVLRKVLMPLAAAPLLLWVIEARLASEPPDAALSLGIVAVCESFVLLLLGLWIQGKEQSPEKLEKIGTAAAASLFACAGIQTTVLPGSVAAMPMLGAGALLAAPAPSRKSSTALAAFVVGGWGACWLIKPDVAEWPVVGIGLAGLLALAAVLGQILRQWQEDQAVELALEKEHGRRILDTVPVQTEGNTQRILQAHGELDGL